MMLEFDRIGSTLNFICTLKVVHWLLPSEKMNILQISDILNPQYAGQYVHLRAIKLILHSVTKWCIVFDNLGFHITEALPQWEFKLYLSY